MSQRPLRRAAWAKETPARPRILLDALSYHPEDGGFATATHDLLDTCARLPEFDFIVAHHRSTRSSLERPGLEYLAVSFPFRARRWIGLAALPVLARRLKADAVHSECSAVPAALGVPASATVHDLDFLYFAETARRTPGRRLDELYWARAFVSSLRRARLVKAVSETTASDIQRLVNAPETRVIHPPVWRTPREHLSARSCPGPDEPLRLITLGSVIPRRNLDFVLAALPLIRRRWTLDIVGHVWWGAGALNATTGDPRVHVHGYVSDRHRDQLLEQAHLLLAASRYEGFGYPVAEALARGLPALTSDGSAFREYVPSMCRFPLDDPGLLARLLDVVDESRYQQWRNLGYAAVGKFNHASHLELHRAFFADLLG